MAKTLSRLASVLTSFIRDRYDREATLADSMDAISIYQDYIYVGSLFLSEQDFKESMEDFKILIGKAFAQRHRLKSKVKDVKREMEHV